MGGDKGLCGAINSGIAKVARRKIAEVEGAGQQANIFYIGGKQSAAMKRLYKDRFVYGVEGLAAVSTNFNQACAVAERLDRTDPERIELLHNHMKSKIAFEQQEIPMQTKKGIAAIDKIDLSKAID